MTQLELEFEPNEAEITQPIEELDASTLARSIEEQYGSTLARAIAYWQRGVHIPLTLATELMEEGYDVGSLEAHHMKG